jgi:hypothetical protein
MQVRSSLKRQCRRRWLIGASVLSVVGAVTIGLFVVHGGDTSSQSDILKSTSLASWSENGRDGRHLQQIADGSALSAGTTIVGVVVSDTLCQPDAQGFSHCHNGIELADGKRMTVIDTHLMSRYPCLEPGQRLSLSRIDHDWIVAQSL